MARSGIAGITQIEYGTLLPIYAGIEVVLHCHIPQTLHCTTDAFTQLHAALADATCEYEGVNLATQLEMVRADVVEDAVCEEIEREPGVGVVGFCVGGDELEVGRSGEGFPPGVLVEDFLGVGDVQTLCFVCGALRAGGVVGVMKYEAGVDGAGAGRAWEAGEWGEAHGGIEGDAVLDCACGGT
jgi:hypothetical protein